MRFLHELNELREISKRYEEVLIESTLANSKLKDVSEQLSNALTAFKLMFNTGATCNICMDGKITYLVMPCKHAFCGPCSRKVLRGNKCFTCRSECTSLEKVYL